MDVTEALDTLRADIAGCELVAYADLSSQMVLSVSARARHGQEEMDALSQSATALLNGAIAEGTLPLIGEEDTSAHIAMTLDADTARVFLRSGTSPDEVLICVCAPNTDMSALISKGRTMLASVADTQ